MTQENTSNLTVGILMGSDTDWPVMKAAADALAEFGIVSEARVISAHRTPRDLEVYASSARERGVGVIIAGAGGAAHLRTGRTHPSPCGVKTEDRECDE